MSMTYNDDLINDLYNIADKLENITDDKIDIKIGTMTEKYWNGTDYITIKGNLFLKINQDTVFKLIDDKKGIVDNFDVPSSDGNIMIKE